MKTVAIVGFARSSLDALKETQADEIWTMNYGSKIIKDYLPSKAGLVRPERSLPRIDRLFEIHKEEWIRRDEIPDNAEYWEWLKGEHDFPIYMQDVHPEVPCSVRYPFEAVKALFTNLRRAEKSEVYLTSSFSFMLALAILEKFDRIEIHGVEMATDTEFGYQKPGGEFLIGYALARGIEVILRPSCALCNARIYAYEFVPHISDSRVAEIVTIYQAALAQKETEAQQAAAAFNTKKEKDYHLVMNATALADGYRGAELVLRQISNEGKGFISRQTLELSLQPFIQKVENWKGKTNQLQAEFNYLHEHGKEKASRAKWGEFLQARRAMYANDGAVQCLRNLINECDAKRVDHTIRVAISETVEGV
jgi:hypothetical protein